MAGDTGIELDRCYSDEYSLNGAGQGGVPFLPGKLVQRQTGEIYRFVQYQSGETTAAQKGDVVYYSNTTAGKAGMEVTIDSDDDSDRIPAGVLMAEDGLKRETAMASPKTEANYKGPKAVSESGTYYAGQCGWIMVKGRTTLRQAIGNGAGDGDSLCASTTGDGTLEKTGSGNERAQVGIAVDASAKLVSVDFPV